MLTAHTSHGDSVYRALADRTRREIVATLADRPLPVHALARHFRVSRPAVSQHLGILKAADLVEVRRRGRENLYHLKTEALRDVEAWLNALWARHLGGLKALIEEGESR